MHSGSTSAMAKITLMEKDINVAYEFSEGPKAL